MHNPLNLDVDGLQQQKITSDFTAGIQELEAKLRNYSFQLPETERLINASIIFNLSAEFAGCNMNCTSALVKGVDVDCRFSLYL